MLKQSIIVAATAVFVTAAAAQQGTPTSPGVTSTLPGGASSLRESHGDWTVGCAMQQQTQDQRPTKICSLGQEQLDNRSRQRVFAIELRPSKTTAKATLILPFGLDLQRGVTLQMDDGQAGPVQPIRTCLAAGCLVEVDFDAAMVASLGKAKTVKVSAIADGKDTPFTIPMNGFQSAYNRTLELAK